MGEVFSGYCNFCKKKFTNRGTYDMHLTSKKHLEREQLARDRAEDETLTGTTSTITKRPIEAAESKTEEKKQEGEKETPDSEKTEEEFIAEKVRNAYKFEENQCIVCMQRNNSSRKTWSIWQRSMVFTFLIWSMLPICKP